MSWDLPRREGGFLLVARVEGDDGESRAGDLAEDAERGLSLEEDRSVLGV